MSTIKHLVSILESTNERAREDTRRKPVMRASWIQKRILNDRPYPRLKQLKEKRREYNSPLCIAFVDNEKAFDPVHTQAVLISFQEQGKDDLYIEPLKEFYTNSFITVDLYKESNTINIRRDREIPYRTICSRQHSKAYSVDWLGTPEAWR